MIFKMMKLIIDIGNTRIKVAVVHNCDILHSKVYDSITEDDVRDIVARYPATAAIVSSTRGNSDTVCDMLRPYVAHVVNFSPATTPIPLGNDYHTPQTLGADRLAAAVGCAALYPEHDIMIVDFGTAITIDYVIDGRYRGGNISPGVTTRFRALADYTARLPLCTATEEVLPYGRTTVEAIEQGVMRGVENEIRGYVEAFYVEKQKKCVIFTGGDAKYFVKRIKNAIFADCEPVIYGLATILEYDAEKL